MRLRSALAAAVAAAALTGCTAEDLPLPGGGVDGATFELNAEFADALNLPAKAHVKLNGVRVGTVTGIAADDYRALVKMDVQRAVVLPRGTRAELRQATPLGDVFVALQPPKDASGTLGDGDTIGLAHTSSAATVEDSLSAMAMLVNGGGLAQMGDIVDEVNTALDGRGPKIRDLVRELTRTLKTLNGRTDDIDRILHASDRLTRLATKRRPTIDAALSDLGPAVDVASNNTTKIRKLLTKAAGTAQGAELLLAASSDDVQSLLRDGGRVLDGLGSLRDDLGPTLRSLVTLGEFVHGATKGEAGSGAASFEVDDVLRILEGNGVPGADDLSRSTDASLRTLMAFIEKVGGR